MAALLFSDLATQALQQCGNRNGAQDVTLAQQNVFSAVMDICSAGGDDYYFEELEVIGPNFNLVANVNQYVVTNTAGPTITDINGVVWNVGTWLYPSDTLQSISDMIVYTDSAPTGNSATSPAPQVQIQNRSYQRQDRISNFPSTYPVLRSRRGSATTITGSDQTTVQTLPILLLQSVPNGPWTTYMTYRRMHPLVGVYPYSGTGLILTREWIKPIIDLTTALLYAGWLKEPDRATEMRKQLGLTLDESGKPILGLVQTLMSKRKREFMEDATSYAEMRPMG